MRRENNGRNFDIESEFVQLGRLSVEGKAADVHAFLRRSLRTVLQNRPDLEGQVRDVLSVIAGGGVTRNYAPQPLPVDIDSRLELLRRENVTHLEVQPVWFDSVSSELNSIIEERRCAAMLSASGITPTRSMLLVGPPGVGKTLSARYLAKELNLPLLTLDLAGVMSSYLGKTGNNIRSVLDYAQKTPSILLLDEFDAIAKRRDDVSEIGELKRLVTVLLQSVDSWPDYSILIAATNHPELLDTAVWRRFDRRIFFTLPTSEHLLSYLENNYDDSIDTNTKKILSLAFSGVSFSEISRVIMNARRESIIKSLDFNKSLMLYVSEYIKKQGKPEKRQISKTMTEMGISQRQISEYTGLARDTIRNKSTEVKEDLNAE
jgi:SpoVK/Ycf46/Vps4 family AAA+-type ATPase